MSLPVIDYDQSLQELEHQKKQLELLMKKMGDEWAESGPGIAWLGSTIDLGLPTAPPASLSYLAPDIHSSVLSHAPDISEEPSDSLSQDPPFSTATILTPSKVHEALSPPFCDNDNMDNTDACYATEISPTTAITDDQVKQ